MIAQHYWLEFYQIKAHINYVELCLAKTERIDRALKIFLAVTSSGSIGAWVIWKEYAMAWAVIIAVSQVLNAIRGYLPYKERLRDLAALLNELEVLSLSMEAKWLDIMDGRLTEREITKALSDARARKQKSVTKHFPATVIPDDPKLLAKAEEITRDSLSIFYQKGEEHEH